MHGARAAAALPSIVGAPDLDFTQARALS